MEMVLSILTLLILVGIVVVLVMRRPPQVPPLDLSPVTALVDTVNRSLNATSEGMATLQSGLSKQLTESIGVTNSMVQSNIDGILKAIHSNQANITESTGQVGQRLDSASRVISEVQTRLGELTQATKEIKDLGQSVSALQQLLQAPKLRGGFGEMLLEDLLRQVLPSANFEIQHRFRTGNVVDALVKTSFESISVDSKFPFENFKRAMQAQSDTEKKAAIRLFISDVKKHIEAVSSKYILPDEGTFPFAIMYIPIESIYYELIVRDNSIDAEGEVHAFALSKKVIPVSPSSFYAYLVAIAYGLRGLQIEKGAQDIINGLTRVQGDIERFTGTWNTLGTHLKNAQGKYDEGDKQFTGIGQRINTLAGHTDAKTIAA